MEERGAISTGSTNEHSCWATTVTCISNHVRKASGLSTHFVQEKWCSVLAGTEDQYVDETSRVHVLLKLLINYYNICFFFSEGQNWSSGLSLNSVQNLPIYNSLFGQNIGKCISSFFSIFI